MAKKKNFWYVIVMANHGPVFVTKINHSDKTAEWNKEEAPLELDEFRAKDLALGLNLNLNSAFAVCQPFEIDRQPFRYDKGEFEWKWKENEDE